MHCISRHGRHGDRAGSPGPAGGSGFTLLEVMIGVTIFGIISIAIYSTFRVGLKSYEQGREQMLITQTGRGVFELLSRDLRSIYYQPPKSYNQNLIAQLQRRHQFINMRDLQTPPLSGPASARQRQAMQRLAGKRPGDEAEDERLRGIPLNLTILGSDSEKGDALTFVNYQVHWGTASVEPWALARVKYWVEDGNLFRAEGPIWVEEIPSFQWQPPALSEDEEEDKDEEEAEEEPTSAEDVTGYLKDAPRELIARNVESFDLVYGYWTDEGWFEAPNWTAHQQQYRNPPLELDLYENSDPEDRGDIERIMMQRQRRLPTDDIPAYVTVTLKLAYGRDNARSRLFRSKIRLLTSTETFEPFFDPSLNLNPGAGSGQSETPFGRR